MNIVEFAKQAIQLIEESGIPTPYRTTVLSEMIREQGQVGISRGSGQQAFETEGVIVEENAASDEGLRALSRKLGVSTDDLTEIFVIDSADSSLELTVDSANLPHTKKEAVQQLAILVCCFRQGLGIEEFTNQKVIAKSAEEYGVRDSNFARHLEEVTKFFQVKGPSRSREFRLKRVGWEEAEKIVQSLIAD